MTPFSNIKINCNMENIFKRLTIALACAALAFTGCNKYGIDEEEYLFSLYNNSDAVIGWYIPVPGNRAEDEPELPKYMPETIANPYKHIFPGDKYQFLSYEVSDFYLPGDAVKLYIFKTEVLSQYTWDEIREHNMYEYCYNLTVTELKENGRKVYYEGD